MSGIVVYRWSSRFFVEIHSRLLFTTIATVCAHFWLGWSFVHTLYIYFCHFIILLLLLVWV